ncbi:MAG: DMT family transporter [Bacteroidota bacterium]|nr:DMT family transporter [Bacteroidota bacterium]
MKWNRIRPYLEIILAMLFWSASFIWYKEAYLYLGPITLVFFRMIVASMFLFGLSTALKQLERIKRKDIKYFILLAFVEPLLYFLGESHGMMLVSSTLGSVIASTIPLFTPFAALLFYREKISWIKMAGVSISFAGVLIVVIGKGFQLIAPIEGIALMFLAVFAAVGHSIMIVFLIPRYSVLTIILAQSFVGALYFLPIFIFTELGEIRLIQWNWAVMAPIIKLGIFPSSLSFILYTRTVRSLGITRSNVFISFIPVFTAIMAYFILEEEMTTGKILGILIVLTGLLIAQSRGFKRQALKQKPKRFL